MNGGTFLLASCTVSCSVRWHWHGQIPSSSFLKSITIVSVELPSTNFTVSSFNLPQINFKIGNIFGTPHLKISQKVLNNTPQFFLNFHTTVTSLIISLLSGFKNLRFLSSGLDIFLILFFMTSHWQSMTSEEFPPESNPTTTKAGLKC